MLRVGQRSLAHLRPVSPIRYQRFTRAMNTATTEAPPATEKTKKTRRLLLAFLPITLASLALGLGLGSVGVYGAFRINRTRPRWFSDKFVLTPESLRMPYHSFRFHSEDGVELEGWYIEQTVRGKPSDRVVLCNNPFNHDKSTLLAVARALWDTGHSVLLYDFRAFGPKPVTHETIGHLELRDGRAALAWLRENKPSTAKIGLMGCSMGGAVALMLAEEDDHEIVGVATDCAFACLGDVVEHYIQSSLPENLPGRKQVAKIITDTLAAFNSIWYGYDVKQVGPQRRLDRLRVPLLVLHSEEDSVVPLYQARKIFYGAATPDSQKKLVIIKGCEHIGSFFENEITYTRRIVSFLDTCFEGDGDKNNANSTLNRTMSERTTVDTTHSEGVRAILTSRKNSVPPTDTSQTPSLPHSHSEGAPSFARIASAEIDDDRKISTSKTASYGSPSLVSEISPSAVFTVSEDAATIIAASEHD